VAGEDEGAPLAAGGHPVVAAGGDVHRGRLGLGEGAVQGGGLAVDGGADGGEQPRQPRLGCLRAVEQEPVRG
jgi:hypothetical protein